MLSDDPRKGKQSWKSVSRADAVDVSIIIQFSLPENLRQSQIDDFNAHKDLHR